MKENGSARPSDIALLYASQTGTAEETAWELYREGRRKGLAVRDPQALDELSLEGLCKLKFGIFVISTTGQGDPPINMRRLWQELLTASLPPTLLCGLCFSVFGLGDTHYREFNYAARKLHARLKNLGAEPFFRLGLGDDQHDFGMEQELDPWAEGMWSALVTLPSLVKVPGLENGTSTSEPELRYLVDELGEISSSDVLAAPKNKADDNFRAEVVASRSLCSEAHAAECQDVWNIRLRMPRDKSFTAGDVCVVWPRTEAALVKRFVVETLGRSLQEHIRLRPLRSGAEEASCPFPDRPLSLEEVFSSYIDVTAVPSRHFFHVLSLYTDDELHKKKLTEFASRTLEAKDALYEYCKRERRSAAEVMWDFWTARPPLPQLLSCLPLLRPRRYSIASCPGWSSPGHGDTSASAEFWLRYQQCRCSPQWLLTWRPNEEQGSSTPSAASSLSRPLAAAYKRLAVEHAATDFDLCVAVVNATTKTNRQVKGLCSNFLKDALVGEEVRISIERGSLRLPPSEVPLIMVCPGTGLSPCRALVQQRHLQQLRLPTRHCKDLLFLGFRHQDGDFLYGDEWETFDSWLSVHVAFSRDHEDKKVYVQDVVEEQGQHVCQLLDAGALIFVCGRSHPMPSQVFDAFVEVLQRHGGMSEDAAAARLRLMQRTQRYICDTWG
eukprot:TRINITY_DN76286_c0_g1_i1.p1 TRINITY_DN76286_c0_g1~~TRINITY_DN76286_c0_g1_i1.p1  ORF type:complete len:691 (-),score=147.29 TRINITY_DN76286_c0_g1_i1:72-2072(-)